MFKDYNDIPEPIKPYYSYTVEKALTGHKQVPCIHGGVHEFDLEAEWKETQVPKLEPFGEGTDKVAQALNRRKPMELILQLMAQVNGSEHKAFHASYCEWLSEEPERVRDEDGTFVGDDENTSENEAWSTGETLSEWQAREPELILSDLYAYPEYSRYRKLEGVEFEGVMCSATKEDFYGLASAEPWIRKGNSTVWEFDNGSKLTLHADNVDAFYAVWMPFRASFFGG